MGLQIIIKDKNLNKQVFNVNDVYSEISVECGDLVSIDEVKSAVVFEVLNNDLKLSFNNGCVVVLINLIKLLTENPNGHIAGQFNDTTLLNAVTTKLEFVKSDLFDESYFIKDMAMLNTFLTLKKEDTEVINTLHKSVKFQYDKQAVLEINNEKFDVYSEENLTIFIHI